ncbi:aldose 1-epimerase family protein [Thermasporomyces composti]|uniref:Aldose 1-epimerase n=1 Tax=Thermasporomyces composti TaxID=696763 RepID=A0A3D9VCC7_THECX|nr:aldose 1-epimerase family protein [Thermasporomyces composti]REF35824.1 aldose 1-epimerase [Thermasporomyces composti]
MQPSGDQYSIAALGYTATISEVGATLRTLHYQGRPLVAGFAVDQIRPVYRGALLAPWPNRIADGAYEFGGVRHQLPLNEPTRHNALHGLVSWAPWTLLERSADQVVLGYRLFPQDGYPFRLDFTVTYVLSVDGLTIRLHAHNAGTTEAPYGCAPHPYLVAGDGKVDDWTLQLPAREYLEVTPDRLLPVRVRSVEGTSFDFREPRPIGTTFIDHAFTGLEPDQDGRTRARVVAGDGHGVEISWDSTCSWVQVHTADRPEPELHRSGLAVEPMTCPPDAFNSHIDLVVLAPGESHQATWTITAI